MKKKKIVTAVLSLIIVFSVLAASVYAYRGVAYLFLYDSYLDYAETCVFDLIMYGFDTGSYVHNSAADIYSVMPTSSILVHFGEGGPGYVFCENADGVTSAICGDTNCDEYLYPTIDRAVSNMPYVTDETNLLTM
ncbi:MAG: hypothetical protein IJ386_03645, partial [Clostridia bacterium]|nr:hypothetical protein [Clostridia bacterium]